MNTDAQTLFSVQPDGDYRTLTTQNLTRDIIHYYDSCFWDYLFAWSNSRNLALHYGYWDKDTRNHSQSLLNMNRAVAEQVRIGADDYILDAGCGLGGSAIWLAENFGCRVVGITLSERQVKFAAKNARKRNVADLVEFRCADFCDTPFGDRSFDVVWGLESVCYAVRKQEFVREAYRILKDNGRLVIADGLRNRSEFTAEEWKVVVTCLNGWSVPNLATAAELLSYMTDAGFPQTDYRDISRFTLPSAKYMHHTALLTYPLQKISRLLRIRNEVQNANYLAGLHQYSLMKQGISGYGILSATK